MKRVGASTEPSSRSLGSDWDLFMVGYFEYLGDFFGAAGLHDDLWGVGGLEAVEITSDFHSNIYISIHMRLSVPPCEKDSYHNAFS